MKNQLAASDFSLLEFFDLLLDDIASLPDTNYPDDDVEDPVPVGKLITKCDGWSQPSNTEVRLSTPEAALHYPSCNKKGRRRCLTCKNKGVYPRCSLCTHNPSLCVNGKGADNCLYRFPTMEEFDK